MREYLQIKNRLSDRRGATLVELIVTFALLGLFMTAAASMLTSTLQLFTRMQATSRAITVSDMLLDKISGEITAAILPPNESTDGYYFWLQPKDKAPEKKSRWVVFQNRSRSPVAIFAAEAKTDAEKGKADAGTIGKEDLEGELFIRYYEVAGGELRQVPELDWHLDSRAYMGYTIKELWFEQEKLDHPNVIKIHLTLYNKRTGFEYSTFRYAENYNYDFNSNYMCERDQIADQADKTSFPVEAEEFKIKQSSGGGDPEEPPVEMVDYTIVYMDAETKQEIIPPDDIPRGGQAVSGSKVRVDPPEIPGYVYDPTESVENEAGQVIDEIKNVIYLYYKKVDLYLYYIKGYRDFGDYTVLSEDPDYTGTGWSSIWELFREPRYAPLSDNEKVKGKAPVFPGYSCKKDPYTIRVASTHTETVEIPYKPQEVTVTIHAKYGSQIDTTTLTGYYDSIIGVNNNKKIPGYTCNTTYVQIPIDRLSGIEYTFVYTRDWSQIDAPFPPQGPVIEIEPSREDDPDLAGLVQKVAEKFSDFFLENWSVLKDKNTEIGYRTFIGADGKEYAIAGYCELDNSHSVSKYKAEIAAASGVDQDNIIYLTDDDGFKNDKEMEWLWDSLISQMDNLTQQEKDLLLSCQGQELEFKKIWNDKGNVQFVLEELSFEFADGMEAEAKYKKSY